MTVPDRSIPFYNLILRCGNWQGTEEPPPEGVRLRGYEPGDEAAWAALEYKIGDFTSPGEARRYFQKAYGSRPEELAGRCVFAVDGRDRVLGTCIAWRDCGADGGEVASLHWLAVSPEEQGRGLGRALFRRALSIFRERGESPIYIHTQPWSWKALRLYVREGFCLQRADTFGGYENQYRQGMETLETVLPKEWYRELLRSSEG